MCTLLPWLCQLGHGMACARSGVVDQQLLLCLVLLGNETLMVLIVLLAVCTSAYGQLVTATDELVS